uniref:Uncharacterized protein n=1 Tax=Catharus ustulatus TaxID=91951 RepID=A0A8C3UMQ2_CATUS
VTILMPLSSQALVCTSRSPEALTGFRSSSNGGCEAAPVEQWALQGDSTIWCLQPCGLTESESIFLLYGTRAVSEKEIMKASFFPCICSLAAPALAVLQPGT